MSIGTVQDLASALRDGRRDPVDLVAEVFDRIDRHNDPALFIRTLRPRAEAEARASRERLRAAKDEMNASVESGQLDAVRTQLHHP